MLEAPVAPLTDDESALRAEHADLLRCAVCRRAVTARSEAIRVAGAHAHVCTNPAGQTFRIGCFASAPGALARGPSTALWSWFDGHRWRIAECRGCGVQLGWHFAGTGGRGFYGLTLAALVESRG